MLGSLARVRLVEGLMIPGLETGIFQEYYPVSQILLKVFFPDQWFSFIFFPSGHLERVPISPKVKIF